MLPSVNAQKKTKEEKDVDVKIEKIITNEGGHDKTKTKIAIIKDGKVIIEEEGEDLDLSEVLKKSGLSEEDINNISVKVDGAKGSSGNKMVWVTKAGDGEEFDIRMEDENVFVFKDGQGHVDVKKFHTGMRHPMMMHGGSNIGVYDYSKSDKDLKEFKVKQRKEIDFSNIEISVIRGAVSLNFECPKNNLEVSIKDAKGKKVHFEKHSDFEGRYTSIIPVSGEKDSVYILEVKSGDRNWLQKIKIE